LDGHRRNGERTRHRTDYPDLSAFQHQGDAFQADAEAMKLIRSGIEHVVESSVHDELFETAPHLA